MVPARTWMIVGLIFAAAAARLVPHPWNMTPITAVALFGAARLKNLAAAFLIPLAAMAASDLVLGVFVYGQIFHRTMFFVYASFLLIVGIGLALRDRITATRVLAAAIAGSLLFFLVTNFGVWLLGNSYPHTLSGLLACFAAGLPFFGGTLTGDLLYTGLLFGVYEIGARHGVKAAIVEPAV